MIRPIRRALSALVLSAVGATLASASTIYVTPQTVSFSSLTPSSTQTLTFNKFDPTLYNTPGFYAALTSVEIDLNVNSTGTVTIVNISHYLSEDQNTGFTNARTFVPIQVSSVGGLSFGLNAVVNQCGAVSTPNPAGSPGCTNSGTGTLLDPYGIAGVTYPSGAGFGLANSDTRNVWSGLTGTASQNAFIGLAGLSSYIGSGTGNLSVNLQAGGASSAGTDLSANYLNFGGTATSDGSVSITYGYELQAVPEPQTFAVMGAGLLGLGVLIRKRNRK